MRETQLLQQLRHLAVDQSMLIAFHVKYFLQSPLGYKSFEGKINILTQTAASAV